MGWPTKDNKPTSSTGSEANPNREGSREIPREAHSESQREQSSSTSAAAGSSSGQNVQLAPKPLQNPSTNATCSSTPAMPNSNRVYPAGYCFKLVYEDPNDIESPKARCHKRMQGKVNPQAAPNMERLNYKDQPKDPRGLHRYTFQSPSLYVPEFVIDEYYVGTPPRKEVGIFELNDNVDEKILSEIVRKVGETREIFVYKNPKTGKHLKMAAIIFKSAKYAQKFVEEFSEHERKSTEPPRRTIMGTPITCFLDPYLTLINERYEELMACSVPLPKHLRQLPSALLVERREAILAEKRGLLPPPPAPNLSTIPTTPPSADLAEDDSDSPQEVKSQTLQGSGAKSRSQVPPSQSHDQVTLPPPPPTPTLPPPPMPPEFLMQQHMNMMHIGYPGQQQNMMMSGYHRLQTSSGQPMQRTYLPPPGVITTPVLAAPLKNANKPEMIPPSSLASISVPPPPPTLGTIGMPQSHQSSYKSPATPPPTYNHQNSTPSRTPSTQYTESLEARVKNVFNLSSHSHRESHQQHQPTSAKRESDMTAYVEPIRPDSSIDMSINGEEDMDVEFSSEPEEETEEEKEERLKRQQEELKREVDHQVMAALRRTCEELQQVVLNDIIKKMEASGRQRIEIFLLNRRMEEEARRKEQEAAAAKQVTMPLFVKQEVITKQPDSVTPSTNYMNYLVPGSRPVAAAGSPTSFTSFLPKFPSFKRKALPTPRRQAPAASSKSHARSHSRSASSPSSSSSSSESSRSSSPAASSSSSSDDSSTSGDEQEENESVPSPGASSRATSSSDIVKLNCKPKAKRLLSSEDSVESRSRSAASFRSTESEGDASKMSADEDAIEAEENVPPPPEPVQELKKPGRPKRQATIKHKFISVKDLSEDSTNNANSITTNWNKEPMEIGQSEQPDTVKGVPALLLLDSADELEMNKQRAVEEQQDNIWRENIHAYEYHSHLTEHCYPQSWLKSDDQIVEENVRAIYSKMSGTLVAQAAALVPLPPQPEPVVSPQPPVVVAAVPIKKLPTPK
ncbi:hypothetical protein WR25_18389 [Diploscapter pachys]|uniref:RRM domain-containing protein n=1 Tax=Diploscapter pachys TaxID=2018661 RepID=A0A2A2JZK2_9BILA|nr:hypothetical protein WR25_18389 [Diploscapter pachys]